jgi:hypothetical protein
VNPREALAAHALAVGARLSERTAALWPELTGDQRAALHAEETEDGFRALLDAYEQGEQPATGPTGRALLVSVGQALTRLQDRPDADLDQIRDVLERADEELWAAVEGWVA